MTQVEFSRLLSELTETAKSLNAASDSINTLIKRFEDTLRSINLGLEVWLTSESLDSVNLDTMRALCTRNYGEVISNDAY